MGSRFGCGKLLAVYQGRPLIEGALRAGMAAPVSKIVLVTGHEGDKVGAAAVTLAARQYPNRPLQIVHAPDYREGMAATLRAGVAALSQDVDGAFVFLGDMPRIPHGVASKLAESIGECAAAAPVFRGERGHPVLFAARLFPTLLQLRGDQGARGMLDALQDGLALVEVDDDGVVFDVDLSSDLAS